MKKVITYGTFDMFHEGHYNILKRAKEYGDYLIVGVTGESYDVGRGKLSVRDSLAERINNVKNSGFADQIIVEEYLGQKISDIIKYDVDVFVIGDDWKGKFDHIAEYCELVYLPRTEGISSTQIRETTFRKHRIGIIADRVDDNQLVSEAKKVSGFSVEKVFSEDTAIADAFSKKYDICNVMDNLEELFDDVDIVFVRTELKDRYRFMKAAIKRDKHVIGEVPFSIDEDKQNELFELAKQHDVVLMHNLKVLHTQVFVQLLWMIKAGLIGDVIRIDCATSKHNRSIKQLFYELTASALAIVLNIMGTDYEKIAKRIIRDTVDIEYMSMTITYPNTEVIINIGNNIRVESKIEIVGSKGSIRLGENWWRADSFELLPVDEDNVKRYYMNYDGNGFKFLIKDLLVMIDEHRREYPLMNRDIDTVMTIILQDIE